MSWLFSADNHIIEPEDTWSARLPRAMRDRAPRYVTENGLITGYVDGEVRQLIPASAFGTDMLPADSNDVAARLATLEADGVWGEGLLGNLAGVVVMCLEEPEFAAACARAYNDWLAETFGPYRDRVVGHALIPVCVEPEVAVAEIERAAEMGFRSLIVPLWPPEPYYLSKFDPLWEAAAAHKMPVCMHAHTGRWFRKLAWGDLQYPEIVNASGVADERERAAVISSGGGVSFPQQGYQCFRVAGGFIGSGTLDRLPDLHLVFVECGAAWLLSAAEWLDDVWRTVPGADRIAGTEIESLLAPRWPYELSPSDYLRRQVHVTFQDEPAAIRLRHQIGLGALMWGQDIPHNEGTWPRSREITDQLFADLDHEERQAIAGGNFAELFGIAVPA